MAKMIVRMTCSDGLDITFEFDPETENIEDYGVLHWCATEATDVETGDVIWRRDQ